FLCLLVCEIYLCFICLVVSLFCFNWLSGLGFPSGRVSHVMLSRVRCWITQTSSWISRLCLLWGPRLSIRLIVSAFRCPVSIGSPVLVAHIVLFPKECRALSLACFLKLLASLCRFYSYSAPG